MTLTERLQNHVRTLAIPRHAIVHPEGHEIASRHVQETLLNIGLKLESDPFPYQGETYRNWIATEPSDRNDFPVLVVGAHFDSIPDTPGADDNATGVAVMLEVARLYHEARQAKKRKQRYMLEFIGFDLEECVTVGSIAYARRLKLSRRKVAGMLSLEMLGYTSSITGSQQYPKGLAPFYPNVGDFVALVGSFRSTRLVNQLRRKFKPILKTETLIVPGTGRSLPDIRRSDHAPFWDQGFPAVLVTDTSFFRNPHYHTALDSIVNVDFQFMTRVTQALDAYLS